MNTWHRRARERTSVQSLDDSGLEWRESPIRESGNGETRTRLGRMGENRQTGAPEVENPI